MLRARPILETEKNREFLCWGKAPEDAMSHTDPWLTYATVKRSQGGGAWFPEGERREKKRERQKGKEKSQKWHKRIQNTLK